MPWSLQRVHQSDMVRDDNHVQSSHPNLTVETLTESIKKNGLLVPINGRFEGNKFFVLDGWKRVQAMRKLGLPFIMTVSFTWHTMEPETAWTYFKPAKRA